MCENTWKVDEQFSCFVRGPIALDCGLKQLHLRRDESVQLKLLSNNQRRRIRLSHRRLVRVAMRAISSGVNVSKGVPDRWQTSLESARRSADVVCSAFAERISTSAF